MRDDDHVVWSIRASSDLLEIGEYIARDNPKAARGWLKKLIDRATSAGSMPQAGRIVPELSENDVREVIYRGYRIVYRVKEDRIVVLTIFEGHKQLPVDLDLQEK